MITGLQSCAGFFHSFLRTAKTDRSGKDVFEQLFHFSSRHATNNCQISQQCRQLRSKLAKDFPRDRRPYDLAAIRTNDSPELVFRNVWADYRKLGHLMSVRLACLTEALPILGESVSARASRRKDFDHFIHRLGWNQCSIFSWMPFLSSRFTTGFFALRMNPFVGSWSIRRWRFRRIGRVLFSSC